MAATAMEQQPGTPTLMLDVIFEPFGYPFIIRGMVAASLIRYECLTTG